VTKKKSTPKARKQQHSYRIPKVGTITFWDKPEEGMSGGSYTPLPPRKPTKPRRKPNEKTLVLVDEMAKLLAFGQKGSARQKVEDHWPKVSSKQAWAYWATTKSNYRSEFDAAFAKYKLTT
jgi:hypothetical protein